MPTIQEVRAAFNEAVDHIDTLDSELAAEHLSIKISCKIADRTDAQKARLKTISQSRLELTEVKNDLVMTTFDAYNTASDLPRLLEEVEASKNVAQSSLNHLKEMSDYAVKAAKVASAVAKAAGKLADFLT